MLEAQGTFPRASISYSDLVQFPNQFAKLFFSQAATVRFFNAPTPCNSRS